MSILCNGYFKGRKKCKLHKPLNMKEKVWILYILKCHDDSLYTGITDNIDRRLLLHNLGKASRYTRSRRPVKIIYTETCIGKSIALRKEHEIKRLTRKEKEIYIATNGNK